MQHLIDSVTEIPAPFENHMQKKLFLDTSVFHYMRNSDVIVSNEKGSKYSGKLVGYNQKEGKFCLSKLAVLNKDGTYKADGVKRWFSADRYFVMSYRDDCVGTGHVGF